jgi:hypothetical protein
LALVLVEVKNVRSWIYPTSSELADLLAKAADIQAAAPERPILPVLVCRRAHETTKYMASSLGFLVHETSRQYVAASAQLDDELGDRARLEEVRAELGFDDLVVREEADEAIVKWFRYVPPSVLPRYPQRWARYGPPLAEIFRALRHADPGTEQARWGVELRETAEQLGVRVSW